MNQPDGQGLADRRIPWARLLFRRMSAISEECWAASWLIGNEYRLWDALFGDGIGCGQGGLSPDDLEELRILSAQAQGWIWTGVSDAYTPQVVSFEEWTRLLARRDRPAL